MELVSIFIVALLATVYPTSAEETLEVATNNTSASPSILNVIAINSTSAQVQWNVTVDCPVRRYVVRVKENSSTRARSWRYDQSTKSAVITGLRPATEYNFRLIVDTECHNGKGKAGRWVIVRTPKSPSAGGERVPKSVNSRRDKASLNAAESETTTNQLVPGQPLSVGTRVITPESVLVTWQAPANGGPISGYMIGYGEGVPDVNWQYLEAHRRNVTIKNLKPSTQYVISVRAFNDVDKGPVVYDLIYTTTSSLNSMSSSDQHPAPINLQSRMLSPTSAWVQWMDPSLGRVQRLTDNRYYNVHYQATPNGKTLSVIVRELHAVLNDLEPATRYEFKVRTVKDGQTSPFSETVVNWTPNVTILASRPGRLGDRVNHWSSVPSHDEDDDVNDDHDDQWLKIEKNLVRDSQHVQGGESNKMKREPGSAAHTRHDNKRSKQNVSTSKLQPEVTFSTLVQHRVSAYITWPASDQCSDGAPSQVIGYRLRYQLADELSESVSQNLSENFVLLENLQSGVKYRYQIKYLLENGGETSWSTEGIFDTSPSLH